MAVSAGGEQIGIKSFYGGGALEKIAVQVGNARYSEVDGVLFSKNGDTLVCFPAGRGGEYAMPVGVTVVGDYAFAACSKLTAVTICPGVERVGAWAFSNCGGLESLNLPYGLRYIGDKALYKSDALASIYIYRAQ